MKKGQVDNEVELLDIDFHHSYVGYAYAVRYSWEMHPHLLVSSTRRSIIIIHILG